MCLKEGKLRFLTPWLPPYMLIVSLHQRSHFRSGGPLHTALPLGSCKPFSRCLLSGRGWKHTPFRLLASLLLFLKLAHIFLNTSCFRLFSNHPFWVFLFSAGTLNHTHSILFTSLLHDILMEIQITTLKVRTVLVVSKCLEHCSFIWFIQLIIIIQPPLYV